MGFFGLRSATKAAETEEDKAAREAEEERKRLAEEAKKNTMGTSYTKKGMPRRKAMLDEAGDLEAE